MEQSGITGSPLNTPTIGTTLHYRLSAADVARIRHDRGAPSAQDSMGSPVQEGDVVALHVTRVFPDEHGPGVPGVNGQALLDGRDSYWVTSAREGTAPGEWSWPGAAPASASPAREPPHCTDEEIANGTCKP
jgi:hypothetical protein